MLIFSGSLRPISVWPSENPESGASDHQKKTTEKTTEKKTGITRPRPDGGVKSFVKSMVFNQLRVWFSIGQVWNKIEESGGFTKKLNKSCSDMKSRVSNGN